MKYSVNMLTFDRSQVGKTNYIDKTFESMQRSGSLQGNIDFRLNVHDSGSDNFAFLDKTKALLDSVNNSKGTNHRVHCLDAKANHNGNFCRAVRQSVVDNAEYCILLEDDLAFSKNWLEAIDIWTSKYLSNNYRMGVFYTPYQEVHTAYMHKRRTWEYPIEYFYGNLCWIIRTQDAEGVASSVESAEARLRSGKASDLHLKSYFKDKYPNSPNFLSSAPSYVQHIGVESSINHSADRTCQCFLGEHTDVSKLV